MIKLKLNKPKQSLRRRPLVKNSISRIATEFINNLVEIISEGERSFAELEKLALDESKKIAAKVISAYAESVNLAIAADKKARRETGYSVQRQGDERRLQTLVGEVVYSRTYYKKVSGGYEYLADTALGVERCDRVSEGLSLALATAAKDMSYEKSSRYVSVDKISLQTVMGRVRRSSAVEQVLLKKRCVEELHIDADEAHVTLCSGRKSYVPLISVYEGIDKQGKRHKCKNVFHISEYGKSPDELWEQVLTEIEMRYDLSNTKVYIHGDGAGWIGKGLGWIPNATFVLDKYHKNKAIKTMTASLTPGYRRTFEKELRRALDYEETDLFDNLTVCICKLSPERSEKTLETSGYLKRFMKGISICKTDQRANNGGCTEPHVSHVLSARLSGRPMAWSQKTLKRLAPILACGQVTLDSKSEKISLPTPLNKVVASVQKKFRKVRFGLPHPDSIGRLPISGKLTGTQKLLQLYAR